MEIWNPGYTQFTYFWHEWPFSQWSPADFEVDGVRYNCNEQFMMAEKARLFGDTEREALILAASEPRDQKKLGREVSPFDAERWNAVARELVKRGNQAKFDQMADAKEALLATRGTLLVEASPFDTIWGIGLSAKDAAKGKPWRGANWLGEVLTQIRDGYVPR
jgi:ribA/ribD-fused uncharacterized protein